MSIQTGALFLFEEETKMGKIMNEMYYYEPEVRVTGKYGQELSSELILSLYQKCIQKYGDRLSSVQIDYSKRKDGIKTTAILYNGRERTLYVNHRPDMDVIKIFVAGTKDLPPKEIYVYPDGKKHWFVLDREKHEYVLQGGDAQ
jgi:hypothetical protein